MTQRDFLQDLFEKNKKEFIKIKEILKIIEILKSEKEENKMYTMTLNST